MNLQKDQALEEKDLPGKQDAKQDDQEVANMGVFAARTRETTFSCLPEQPKNNYPTRGRSGIFYPPNWLTCEFCSKTFKKRTFVRAHRHEFHPDLIGDNEIACKFCPRYFSKRAMRCHMKGKHSDKVLEWTPRKKPKNKTLIRRTKTNHPTRFQCKLCKKYVTTKTTLRYHMITHMDEKPYECKLCGCDFTQKAHYTTHFGKYHPEIDTNQPTKWQCGLCHKYFDENKYLKIHITTHMREQTLIKVDEKMQ